MLTVAAIPVAMPTVLSVTMAVGARLLAKRQAIVSKLVAIEELAGVDILCADKTGTLTQNKLTLGDPFCVGDVSAADIILNGALASRADNDDTIDLAVLAGVARTGKALEAYDGAALPAVRSRSTSARRRPSRPPTARSPRSARARPRSSWTWPRAPAPRRPR